jgi:outer membrane lipoprotein-sorting protein
MANSIERAAILAGLLLSASAWAQQPTLTAEQILDKYVEAVGGAEKLDAISTWHEKTDVTGDFGVPAFRSPGGPKSHGTGEAFFKAPRLRVSWVRNDSNVFVVASGCDGEESWIYTPRLGMHTRKLTPDIEYACKPDVMLLPRELRREKAKLELKGQKEVAGRTTFVIRAEVPWDRSRLLYIDTENYLLLRVDLKTVEPPIGAVRITDLYSDFRDVAGIKVAFHRERHTDNTDRVFKVQDVQVNVPIDDKVFQRPNW